MQTRAALTRTISEFVARLRGLLTNMGTARSLDLAVTPTSASRPRVTRKGWTYYDKPYQRFRTTAKAQAADATEAHASFDGPVVAIVEIVVAAPKTGKRDYPRGDVDNYAKGPLDVLTKIEGRFWEDDDQVVGLIAAKRYAAPGEEPGFRITYIPIEGT